MVETLETQLPGSCLTLVRELSSHMAGGVAKNPERQQQQPKIPATHEAVRVLSILPASLVFIFYSYESAYSGVPANGIRQYVGLYGFFFLLSYYCFL